MRSADDTESSIESEPTSPNSTADLSDIEYAEEFQKEKEAMVLQEFDKWYSKRVIYMMFFLVFITNIMINIDHGVLPGCTE